MTKVWINSLPFWTPNDLDVEAYPVQVLADARRFTSQQSRADNVKIKRFIFDNWAGMGIGWQRMRRETGRGVGGMRFSTLETAYPAAIELAPLNESETHADPAEHLKVYVPFLGDLWGFFEENYSDLELTGVFCRKYGATSDDWTGGGTVLEGTAGYELRGMRCWDAVVHGSRMFCLTNGSHLDELSHDIRSSTDAITWSDASGTGWYATASLGVVVARRNTYTDSYGKLLSATATTLLVALLDANGNCRIDKTTDNGTNWSNVATIPTAGYVWGFHVAFNDVGDAVPVVILSDGIWWVDLTNNAAQPLLKGLMTGAQDDGRGNTRASDGNLYISKQDGDIIRISLGETVVGGNRVLVQHNVGPASYANFQQSDGLPSAFQGRATFIYGGDPTWLWVCYGGNAASKNATILRMNYETGAWSHVYNDVTANRELLPIIISSEDDGTTRLHANTVTSSASTMFMFEQPLVSIVTGVSKRFQLNGYVEWAEDDLGDPHGDTAVLIGLVDADDLSATDAGEYIEHEYGLDGAAWTNVSDFGNYVSGDKKLYFGRTLQNITNQTEAGTSVGVSAKTIRHRLYFVRDAADNTQTPKLKEFEVQARNKVQVLYGFRVPIDLALTAQNLRSNITTRTVVNRIKTIIESVILIPMKMETTYGERLVEVANFSPSITRFLEEGATRTAGDPMGGIINLWLEEVQA